MPTTRGFCIFIDTICDGPTPIERDGEGKIVIYKVIEDAQREIAEIVMERLSLFVEGGYAFADAMSPEEFIVEVSSFPDGSILDAAGKIYI